jgi:hypothetical protein
MTTLASDQVAIPAADGLIGLAPKTSDIDANSGLGTTAPVEGAIEAFCGISARTTSGTAVFLQLYDNTAASGPLIEDIEVPANGSVEYDLPNPARLMTGLYLHYVSGAGTVTGVIRIG